MKLMYTVWRLLSFKYFDKVVVLWKKNLHIIIKMLLAAHRNKKHSYFVLIICKLERNQIFARVEEQGEWNLDCKVKIDWVQKKSLISWWSIWDGFMEDVGFGESSAEQRDMEGVSKDRRTHMALMLKVKYSYIILYYIQIQNNK